MKKLPAYGRQFSREQASRNGIHLWIGGTNALRLAGYRVRLGQRHCLALADDLPSTIDWSLAANRDVTIFVAGETIGYTARELMEELLRAGAGHIAVFDHNGAAIDEQGRLLYASGRAAA